MKLTAGVALAALMLLLAACGREALQRSGYETLQNINEQQCQKDFASECPQRESYDAYQRRKKESFATDP